MFPWESRYEKREYWRREVPYRRDVFVDQREALESGGSAASDPFHPDPVDQVFLSADSNAYQHHFDVPIFKYLKPIRTDFQAAHRRNENCVEQVFDAVIVETASSLVTAETVGFALQNTLAHGQYVHQHLGRLQVNSRTHTLEIIDRYALGPGFNDVSAIIVARRLLIPHTPWWRVDTGTGHFYNSHAAGSGSTQKYRWTTGRHDAQFFQTTHGMD